MDKPKWMIEMEARQKQAAEIAANKAAIQESIKTESVKIEPVKTEPVNPPKVEEPVKTETVTKVEEPKIIDQPKVEEPKVEEATTPQDFAQIQTDNEDAKHDNPEPVKEVTAEAVGNPLHAIATNMRGDKVFNIHRNGAHTLCVQSKDKSTAVAVDGSDHHCKNVIKKMKVEFRFPPITPAVSQQHIVVKYQVNDNDQSNDCHIIVPPDVSHISVLLPINKVISVDFIRIDKHGDVISNRNLSFFTNPYTATRPFEPSAIQCLLKEEVTLKDTDQ